MDVDVPLIEDAALRRQLVAYFQAQAEHWWNQSYADPDSDRAQRAAVRAALACHYATTLAEARPEAGKEWVA